jgi:hypothetical protein
MHTDGSEDAGVTGSETATLAPPRARRVSNSALAVVGLVVVSTAARFAAAQAFSTPWIAPDEMVYGMLGEGLWSHGTLTLRSLPSPYYSLLTPALIGAPLAAFDLADGIQWARLLQALAMSLVAVPTYLWARRIASAWWAVAAAALVLASPLLHYAGFLMTEPLTLTVVTVALLMLARALEEPSMWRYGVFVAWSTAAAAVRLQALVLLPAFLLAAVIDSVAARDRTRLRPLLWFAALAALASALVVLILLARGEEPSTRRLLGAYTPVGEATGVGAERLHEVVWHAFDVSVLGLGATLLASVALAWMVLSRRDEDPALRAFVAAALAYTALLVVQVGLFAAVFVGTIAERYLLTVLPLLAIGLCAWISRGAPRALPLVLPAWVLVVVGAATVPITQLATPETLPNAPTAAGLMRLGSDGWERTALVVAALAAGLLVLALPRRFAWITAAAVGVGLALLSVDARNRIADASAHEERVAIGSEPPTWLDDAGLDDATLLVTGDRLWTANARTIFWNRGIVEAVRLAPATTPFPPVTGSVGIGPDGTLSDVLGVELERPLVVTPSTITLVGTEVAARAAGDSEAFGLTAWRPDGPVRVALRTEGFLPNGDFSGTARITVYACRPGTLDVTVLGKSGDPIEARVDGFAVQRLDTPNGAAKTYRIPAPPYANGTRPCVFELENPGYAGTTTIAFSPA